MSLAAMFRHSTLMMTALCWLIHDADELDLLAPAVTPRTKTMAPTIAQADQPAQDEDRAVDHWPCGW
jgi:hypothetical protein